MKRVYRNSDITFNLTVNEFPFNSDIIKNVEFKFFTKNEKNFIRKTKADIVNGSLILEWNELANLEEGIMYYTYNVSVTDASFSDNENNTVDKVITDYFIMSGKTGIDFVQDSAVWGLIEGDIENLKDLVAYINIIAGKKYINEDGTEGGEVFNNGNVASGTNSHAEGNNTIASGKNAHAEGSGKVNKDIKVNVRQSYNKMDVEHFSYNIIESPGAQIIEKGSLIMFEDNRVWTVIRNDLNLDLVTNIVYVEPQDVEIPNVVETITVIENVGARGDNSHVEGLETLAAGKNSHAQNEGTGAFGENSNSAGYGTVADNYAQTALGYLNTLEDNPQPNLFDKTKTLFSIGNGTKGDCNNIEEDKRKTIRSDAVKILGDGTTWIEGIGTFTGTNAEEANSLQTIINNKADKSYIDAELQKKSDKEYIATLENRLKAVEEDLNLGFIALEDGSGRIIPE